MWDVMCIHPCCRSWLAAWSEFRKSCGRATSSLSCRPSRHTAFLSRASQQRSPSPWIPTSLASRASHLTRMPPANDCSSPSESGQRLSPLYRAILRWHSRCERKTHSGSRSQWLWPVNMGPSLKVSSKWCAYWRSMHTPKSEREGDLSRRPTRFSIAMTAFAKLGHRPRGMQAQRFLTELERRLDGADARVSNCCYITSA